MTVTTARPVDTYAPVRSDRCRFDAPVRLPQPRGPVTRTLFDLLRTRPTDPVDTTGLSWDGDPEQAPVDDDLQLALWISYEQHYRGLAGVDDGWEWHPDLVRARHSWEAQFLAGLRHHVRADGATPGDDPISPRDLTRRLNALVDDDPGPSLSKYLLRDATAAEFEQFLIHRSLYQLKEADPHTWVIPRLSGSVKAAMVTIQADEYGNGVTGAMHAQLFRALLLDWGLDARYGHYLEQVPGVTLMSTNLISMFGLHRIHRGALVGHMTLFEMSSSVPNGRYGRGHRRLGGGERAALFFDEHVVADSVHDQIALHDLAGGLASSEPQLVADIVFGAECAAYADRAFAEYALPRWATGTTTLRSSPVTDPEPSTVSP